MFADVNVLYERQLSLRDVRCGTVCVVAAEDESAVSAAVEGMEPDLDKREVNLVGFCGPLCGEVGPDGQPGPHKCGLSGVKFSANGTCQMADLRRIFEQHRVGHYVSVVLIVPLCHDLPVVACHLEVTCNRFTSADIDEKWNWLSEQYYSAGLGETLGPLLGHASDGDVRRRGAQLRRSLRCTAPPGAELYSGVDGLDICVTLSEVNGKQRPCHLSVQDYIHGYKKFFNCFRDTKDMALGVHSISMAALVETVERISVEVHGIRAGDVAPDRNRQNTRPILRMVSPDALAAIATLPDFEERHRGTHAFLSLISAPSLKVAMPPPRFGERWNWRSKQTPWVTSGIGWRNTMACPVLPAQPPPWSSGMSRPARAPSVWAPAASCCRTTRRSSSPSSLAPSPRFSRVVST